MAYGAVATDCSWYQAKCQVAEKTNDVVSDAVSGVAGNALEKAATEIKEAVGEAVASVGTVWVRVKSPTLTGNDADGAPAVQAGDTAGPAAETGILTFLQYASYISLGVCVLALIFVGARMAVETRRNDAEFHVTRVMMVLLAAILISAAGAITTAVMPDASGGESTVAFLENSLWYYTAAAVVLSVIIGGLRMAWEQRAEPGKDLLRSLMTFIVVSGAGVTVISLLLAAGDAYAVWVLNKSLDCSVDSNTKCFGENVLLLLGMSGGSPLGVIAVIILGLCAFIASLVQLGMMIARSGMLIVLAGALPLSASATNTLMGKQMFQKFVGWIIALLLYKPAAAIIYAAAFQLAGSDVIGGGLDALGKVVIGLFMMFLALFTLPALMRLVVPAVGAVASGNAAGNMAMAAAAAVPTGAISAGQLMGGASSAGSDGIGAGGGPSGSNDSSSSDEGSDSSPTTGSDSSPTTGSNPEAGAMSASDSGGGEVAASGEVAAGGAAAAAGPVGLAAEAAAGDDGGGGGSPGGALGDAGEAASSAMDSAKGIGEDAIGEGEGDEPSGSN